MNMGKKINFFSILFLIILLVPTISAGIPGFPHQFYGEVSINNSPAPDGTEVSAEISGKTVTTNIQNPVETINGNYGIDGLPLLVQGNNLQGETIKFFVNGVDSGETYTFEYGGGPTEINLSVTITEDTTGGTTGDTTGGTTGGTTTPTDDPDDTEETTFTSTSKEIITPEDIKDILKESNLTDDEIEEYVNAAKQGALEIERNLTVKKTTSQGQDSFNSTFTIVVRNTSNQILREIKIVEVIPKEIVEDASLISSPHNFRVLVDDPVIEFTINSLNPGQTVSFEYSVEEDVTEELLLSMPGTISRIDFAEDVPEPFVPIDSTDPEPIDQIEPIDSEPLIPPVDEDVEEGYNWTWIIAIVLLIIIILMVIMINNKKSKRKGL